MSAMNAEWTDLAASTGLLVIGPVVAGVVIVAALIGTVWWGYRRRQQQPPPPRPEEQPRLPDSGPVREVRENREPDEVPTSGERLTPHQVRDHSTTASGPSPAKERPRWNDGSSGSFGSGGPGHT